nr:3'-5' exonuclease domain-containing protein [Tanacetum cinerariifolium]
MASHHMTNIPLPNTDPGGEVVPVHVVTHASQLPPEFLHPSADKKLVIGFDCEGVDLCRNGSLCIMQRKGVFGIVFSK